MRSPRDFFHPLAIDAPEPVREIPVRPSRMILRVWKVTVSDSGLQITLADLMFARPSGFRMRKTRRV